MRRFSRWARPHRVTENQEGERVTPAIIGEFLHKQRELIGEHVAKSDVVITTAAIPGRRPCWSRPMVKGCVWARGSSNLAAETGGNVGAHPGG
jgi:NAD/NADP transhydrogenase alpha subunit